MNLNLDYESANAYTSNSQKIRILSEAWALREIYCPSCGFSVNEYENNKPVADFYCRKCAEDFELKSKKGKFSTKVSAGAYSQMIARVNSSRKPNFFFMGYEVKSWNVEDFFVIPKHFFISDVIEMRKPLAQTARRAGWVGSNILFSKIPNAGQIFYVKNGNVIKKNEVISKWKTTVFLKEIKKVEAKGWIIDIMNCIDIINKETFTLTDVYSFKADLEELHPGNKNIKPKIRQQLQVLRDKKYITFLGDGLYKLN